MEGGGRYILEKVVIGIDWYVASLADHSLQLLDTPTTSPEGSGQRNYDHQR